MKWEIDHITSLDHEGKDVLSNVRPLQWENNRAKSSGRLTKSKWAVTVDGNKSLSDFFCNWQNIIRTEPVLFLSSMANRLSAGPQFLIGMVHFSEAFRIAKYSILNRASSVEKVERFLVTLRNW
jgi:hypothetical protein